MIMHFSSFVFNCPTKVLFGEHESASLTTFADELGIKKPLLITDRFLMEHGVIAPIIESLEDSGFDYETFLDVPPDSDIDAVNKAAEFGREKGCNSIIAVGGGSVLDTAKVVNVCLTLGSDLMANQGLNIIESKLSPFVAVPTTAGTGSEVSFVAAIKDSKQERKLVFGSRFLAPDLAILDPTLLASLPRGLTAATGMDAVTHAIESAACAVTKSPLTESISLESLKILFKFLPKAVQDGNDMEARSATLIASTMAGMAFTNSGVGIIHALAHATGAIFKTHHGLTNAVFLSHGMRFNKPESKSIYAKVARALEFTDSRNDDTACDILIDKFEELMNELDIPKDLKSIGVEKMDSELSEKWSNLVLEDPSIMFNPRYATTEDVLDIFERAY